MRTIYKYNFNISDHIEIELPEHSRIIKIDIQNNVPTLWAIVDTDSPIKNKKLRLVGTGHPIDFETDKHIGTFFDSPFVWHVFEL